MTTYLLTWNPARSHWVGLPKNIEEIRKKNICFEEWSTGVTKRIRLGDRVFLMKLGRQEPRGIMASGWANSEVYEDVHRDKEARVGGKQANYVEVRFDTILDPERRIFPRARLNNAIYANMNWEPQASGITIPEDVASKLEKDWARFLSHPAPFKRIVLAEEVDVTKTYPEGAIKQITLNAYERSARARAACVKHHGLNCSVCGFNFEKIYGEIGVGLFMFIISNPYPTLERAMNSTP